MIETLFQREKVRSLQREAPMYEERERYLSQMLDHGSSKRWVRSVACILLHVIRLMELDRLRPVTMEEVSRAGQRWLDDPLVHVTRNPGITSAESFTSIASKWLRFHGVLILPTVPIAPERPFDSNLAEFFSFLRLNEYSLETIRSHKSRLHYFCQWARSQNKELPTLTFADIQDYLNHCRFEGWKPRTVASQCQSLRAFFRYAEQQGWVKSRIALAIHNPTVPRYDPEPKGPKWKDVRLLLAANSGTSRDELRTRAMLLLFAIYGLRRSEVGNLLLEDFDWIGETFVVRRAKRGGVQQFPIQLEVGDAIVRYLRHSRPSCPCRNLFVSQRAPYRPINLNILGKIVREQMTKLGIDSGHVGPHSLRHACATQLLRRGSSLRDIADFLGHRGTKSVSIYAKYDSKLLHKVVDFRLRGAK